MAKETKIELPKGCMIKIFADDHEAKEYLKPYSLYYWDMEQKIRDLKKYQEERLIKNSKNKQELFDKILEELNEVSNEYSSLYDE